MYEAQRMEPIALAAPNATDRPSCYLTSALASPEPAGRFVHNMSINPCLNGYIVNVGCQAVVFQHGSEDLMGAEIAAYLKDPASTEKRFREKADAHRAVKAE